MKGRQYSPNLIRKSIKVHHDRFPRRVTVSTVLTPRPKVDKDRLKHVPRETRLERRCFAGQSPHFFLGTGGEWPHKSKLPAYPLQLGVWTVVSKSLR